MSAGEPATSSSAASAEKREDKSIPNRKIDLSSNFEAFCLLSSVRLDLVTREREFHVGGSSVQRGIGNEAYRQLKSLDRRMLDLHIKMNHARAGSRSVVGVVSRQDEPLGRFRHSRPDRI